MNLNQLFTNIDDERIECNISSIDDQHNIRTYYVSLSKKLDDKNRVQVTGTGSNLFDALRGCFNQLGNLSVIGYGRPTPATDDDIPF